MQKNNDSEKIQAFIQTCHLHHLKVTPQRVAIYQELIHSNMHPSADTVYRSIIREYPHISFDTVNRTLQTFVDIRLVDVVEVFKGAKRFDPNVKRHHHLHCTQCGTIFDFNCRSYDKLQVPDDISKQFQVESKRVILKGVCAACRK